jgi:hypothetical protein
VEDAAVGWVVKQWRTDAARDRAERDARRARRAADRATASLAAQLEALDALERLGAELLATVARHREIDGAAPGSGPDAAAAPNGEAPPVEAPPLGPELPRRPPRRRADRASLRASPLSELFRATGPRPGDAQPPPA